MASEATFIIPAIKFVTMSAILLQQPPSSQLGTRLPIQDYDKLRRQCLVKDTLFEDPYFPADDSSLFYTQTLSFSPKWIRPGVSFGWKGSPAYSRYLP